MTFPRPRLRLRHLILLVAAVAGFLAVMQYRQGVYDPVSAQARRLRSFDPSARLEALDELAKAGPNARSALTSLLGALNDGDARIRARAARLVGRIVLMDAQDPAIGDIRAALTAAIRDPDPSARHSAAVALAWTRPDPRVAVPALIEAAGDGDREVRSDAVRGLGEFAEDEAARSTILAAMVDPDVLVRFRAIQALAWQPDPGRLPIIKEAVSPALKDDDAIIRATAVEVLCRNNLASSPDAPELVAALADPSPEVRTRAALFLPYRPGSRAIIPALIRATTDADTQVRHAAIQRLRWIGLDAEEALPALRRATGDGGETVAREAAEAVRSIEAKVEDFRSVRLPGALADLADPDPAVRRGAAELLADFGPRSAPAVPSLIRALDDGDATVRAASARARIGPAAVAALPALDGRATDPDERVRQAARTAASIIRGDGPGY